LKARRQPLLQQRNMIAKETEDEKERIEKRIN